MSAHILIVDDESHVTNALRRTLAYEGYRISTAVDGESALALARTKPPDLVILDLMLPGINGLEVCRRLRAAGEGVAVLMLTARDTVADRVLGLGRTALSGERKGGSLKNDAFGDILSVCKQKQKSWTRPFNFAPTRRVLQVA